ncbi:MAG: tetratricopeptide repeat protein [Planctomycetota bacterium]
MRSYRSILVLIAALCIAPAAGAGDDVSEREAALKARIARRAEATASDEIVRWYLDRVALAALPALERGAGAARRVRFALADEADRETLAALASSSLASLDELIRDLDARIDRARRDPDEVIVGLPDKLAPVRAAAVYRRAWVGLYLAMVSSEPGATSRPARAVRSRRERRLLDAAEDAKQFATTAEAPDVKRAAALLRGTALARAGEVDAAEAVLKPLVEDAKAGALRVEAAFELARLASDAGRWDVAWRRSEAFVEQCEPAVAPERAIVVRLYGAVLADRVCRRRAAAADDPGEKAAWTARADNALAHLLLDHPDHLPALSAALARPWRHRRDLDALPTAVLVARGVADARETPGAAIACLRIAVDRDDRVSRAFAGTGLWRLAAALYRRGGAAGEEGWADRSAAAERFVQLARAHGDDERAADAAANAARILLRRIDALETQGRPVEPALRRRCAAVLALIVTRWPEQGETLGCTLAVARQYDRLGDRDRALRWYRRVEETSGQYLFARYGELALRSDALIGQVADVAAEGMTAEAEAVVAALTDLVKRARREAQALPASERRRRVPALAAAADYRIARLLADPLGRSDEALDHCQRVVERWAAHEQVVTAAEALRIEVLLAEGRLEAAMAALNRLLKTAGDQAGRRQLVMVTLEVRKRLAAVRRGDGTAGATGALDESYLRLADRACRAVTEADEATRYPLEQMRAEALVENDRLEEAERVFNRLARTRPDDARTLEGLARCYRLGGRHSEAMALYETVLAGLDPVEHADLWWRVQLALARCAYDAADGDAGRLRRLEIRLAQLEVQDRAFGGYRPAFERLRAMLRNK